MNRWNVLGSAVAVIFCLTGCGPTSGAGNDAGQDAGPSGGCNTLANDAPVVSKTSHAEATPTMTGGAVVDGTYFLTAMDKYNGETGTSTHQETWRFSNGAVDVATAEEGSPTQHYSGMFSTSGNMVTFNFTCPMTVSATMPYTATATQLVMVNADDPNEVHIFTKQ